MSTNHPIDSLSQPKQAQNSSTTASVNSTAKDADGNELSDRNFDPIADHFEKKVYGGLKGEIRLAVLRRDLQQQVQRLSEQLQRPLRILDVGAGLAQLSLELASYGHELSINDISENMLIKAQAQWEQMLSNTQPLVATGNAVPSPNSIKWLLGAYQQLDSQLSGEYDLILCHALLEWLAQPQQIIDFFDRWLAKHGVLSLCFYNPVSFEYRNLIMGNFNLLNNSGFQADNKKSLTPNHPVSKEEVNSWLQQHHYQVLSVSGLRVFHDYAPLKRGGHNHPQAVIEMEVKYSQQEPFKWMGRYLHYLATPQS